jgi:hypothetical protein
MTPAPVRDSHIRIKPLALTSSHGRYMHYRYTRTDACVRWGMAVACYSRYKFVTVSIPKRFRNGRFTSETAVRWFKK